MNGILTEQEIDVRSLPPRERHPRILGAWEALAHGAAIRLVNDHDPLPLYYQFACEHTGTFRWEYLERGPQVWRVRIAKGDFADPGFVPPKRTPSAVPAAMARSVTLDVRPFFERGDSPCQAIDEAAAQVSPGNSLILLVPFEPVPLYNKLGRQGFTHRAETLADGTWRIEFKRTALETTPAGACCCSHP